MNKALFGTATSIVVLLFGFASAQAAVPAEGPARGGGGARQAGPPAPTPRLDNGKPDMTGFWGAGRGGGGGGGGGPGGGGAAPLPDGGDEDAFSIIGGRDGDLMNFENDSYIEQKSVAGDRMPQYRPEFWAKVRDLDLHGNQEDPAFHCLPQGVPRMGAPARIISIGDRIMLFNGSNFRDIVVGKKFSKAERTLENWYGFPEARWDGDTLIIESTGFNDQSWMGWGGYFHSYDMKVTETLRRDGNTLYYTSLVEDPAVLMEPWKIYTSTLTRSANSDTMFIGEPTPCIERDSGEIPNNIRG